jgi:hypothetical protein
LAIDTAADRAPALIRIVLRPEPRSWVRFRVVERDGSPVAGVTVLGPLLEGPLPQTGADGRALYAFDTAPGTETWVFVHGHRTDEFLPPMAVVSTGARDGHEVVLAPREPLRVTVAVRGPDGSPLPPGVTASIVTVGNHILRRQSDTAVVGVDPLAPAAFVHIRAPGFVGQHLDLLPSSGYMETRLQRAGVITCQLVDDCGAVVRDGFVRARVGDAEADETAYLEPDGTYRLDTLPDGRATVTAGHVQGLPLARTEADVCEGRVTNLGTLVLRQPRVLSGRVTDTAGRPVGGAWVTAADADCEAGMFSRHDGSFRLSVPPWFDRPVMATKELYGASHCPAAPVSDLVLRSEGCVQLAVSVLSVEPSAGEFSFEAEDPRTGFTWSLGACRRIDRTTYLIRGLPPGRLILRGNARSMVGEADLVVVSGQTVFGVLGPR